MFIRGFEVIYIDSIIIFINILGIFKVFIKMIWKKELDYFFYSYDVDLEIGICVNVKGICVIFVYNSVFYFCINFFI